MDEESGGKVQEPGFDDVENIADKLLEASFCNAMKLLLYTSKGVLWTLRGSELYSAKNINPNFVSISFVSWKEYCK